jgi:colanic acid/amylovoran biosynthesis glycosyltransferase
MTHHGLRVDIVAYDDDQAVSGPASWAARMPRLLRDRGIDVRLLLLNWGCGEAGMLARHCRDSQLPYHTQEFGRTSDNVEWLLSKIKSRRPDVFVCNHVLPALFIGGTLRKKGIPSVGILRSDDPFYHAVIEKFVGGRPQDTLSAIVGVSKYLCEVARKSNTGIIVEKISSGTPVGSTRASYNSPLKIVYAGRFAEEQKRIYLVTQSLIRTCQDVPGTTAIMIGEGPELTAIKKIVMDSGLPIQITGRVDPEEAKRLICSAQVQILFSDYEGLPTSLLEGMSAGVVPICTPMRSGIDELIIDNTTGFLVSNSLHDLTPLIQQLTQNDSTWESVSSNAYHHVKDHFSLESSADCWLKLLKRLYDSRSAVTTIPTTILDLPPEDPRLAREDRRNSARSLAPDRTIREKTFRLLKRLIRLRP